MMKYLNAVRAVLGVFAALACLTVPFSGCASKESELEKGTSAFLKVDDYENALKLVEGFILENPEKPIGHAMLAKVLAANGQTEKALKAYYQFYKLGETLSEELLLELLLGALNDDSWEVRAYAIMWVLKELGDNRAVPDLINLLNDDDSDIGQLAAEALGKLGDERGILPLINALNHDSWSAQEDAAKALGKLGDKSAVPHLIKILNDDGNWVRWEAAEAIGELGDKSAIPALINALNDNHWVRGSVGKVGR